MKPPSSFTPEQVRQGQIYPLVADLHRISPWRGVFRFLFGAVPLVVLIYKTMTAPTVESFLGWGLLAGAAYASLLILTHDALHHTLSGWAWFDEIAPRIVAYPALWPHGLYSELHKIHHKMNGVDLRDPERVQWTQSEYDAATPFQKWTARHQWWLSLLVLGGFGMIYAHIRDSLHLRKEYPRLAGALVTDIVGILVVNAAVYAWAASCGRGLKYLCFYLLVERIAGFVQQLRSHVEHYGLWAKSENPVATQVFNSRNLTTTAFGSVFFNRLNYHSAHHAFPRIPFYHLRETTERLSALYAGRPLPRSKSYFGTAWNLARNPRYIA